MHSARPNVVLLSCYELGRQPLGLATPLAFLQRAGVPARAIDLAVEGLDDDAVRGADFIGVSVPMHTALRLGIRLVPRLRALNPRAHLCYFGLYASLNAELLLGRGADSVLSGECERALVEQVLRFDPSRSRPAPFLERLDFPIPSREGLPTLDRYVRLELASGSHVKAASVETTRGCLHHCRHCPIPPIYAGRFFVVPKETVLGDISRLVEAGARHIDFADPDFLNGPGHALAIARELHREHPGVTFDFTAKIEHLLRSRELLPELAELGCLFIVSAVESLSERVLGELSKGHSREDVFRALDVVRESGSRLRPTFIPFTPWSTLEDYIELLDWIRREDLVEDVDPVQLTLRLLVPPGSLLVEEGRLVPPILGELDREGLTYRWTHPDARMDALQRRVSALVEAGVSEKKSNGELFLAIWNAATGEPAPLALRPRSHGSPRLTEAWFC